MDEPPGQTVEEKLEHMQIDDFEQLLEACSNTREKTVEHKDIISKLENISVRNQPEESQQNLTSSKYNSSSLQSLNDKDKQGKHTKTSSPLVVGSPREPESSTVFASSSYTLVSSMNTVLSQATPNLVYPGKSARESIISSSNRSHIDNDYRDRINHNLISHDDRESNLSESKCKSHVQLDEKYPSVNSVTRGRLYSAVRDGNTYETAISTRSSHSPPLSYPQGSSIFSTQPNLKQKRTTIAHKNGTKKGKKIEPMTAKDLVGESVYKGDACSVDELVAFVQGGELVMKTEKRGPKKRDNDCRDKYGGSDVLNKSLSLDDDNLQLVAKKSTEKVKYSSLNSSLKDFEDSSRFEANTKQTAGAMKASGSTIRKKSSEYQLEKRESDPDETSPARDFTEVVRRKKKSKSTSITSPQECGSGNRNEMRRNRNRGERRKSVGSAHGSDNSEGSDDGSVRSLPVGECTARENIPKSCASSGGTPQTSYADIARSTRDEEVAKEVRQTPEDYPSLHGSDNCEGSEDGSDVSGTDGTPKTVHNKALTGTSAPTSYADIAKVASGSVRTEDKRQERKDTGRPEFPELSTAELQEPLPSPKSDISSAILRHEDTDIAFPELPSNSIQKNMQSESDLCNIGSQAECSNALPQEKVENEPQSSVGRGYVSNSLNAQVKETSLASAGVPDSQANRNLGSANPNSMGYKNAIKKSSNRASSADSKLSASQFVQSGDVFEDTKSRIEHVSMLDTNGYVVNGHQEDSELDQKASDNAGAKLKSPFAMVTPDSSVCETDTHNALCTEAVIFCGENFKEAPLLPRNALELEFGFEMNEVLRDFNKKGNSASNSDIKTNVPPCIEALHHQNEFATNVVIPPFQPIRSEATVIDNLDHGDVPISKGKTQSFRRERKYSASSFTEDGHYGGKPQEGYGKNKRSGMVYDKGSVMKNGGSKSYKRTNLSTDAGTITGVPTAIVAMEGRFIQPGSVITAYPMTAMGTHGLPSNFCGIQYPLPVASGQNPYNTRTAPIPAPSAVVPVPMTPIVDGQLGQYPPVSFIPSNSASHVQPILVVPAGNEKQLVSEALIVTASDEPPSRSTEGHEYCEDVYVSVPEQTQSQSEALADVEIPTVQSSKNGACVLVIQPNNFAQHYQPPDLSLFSNANVDGLRSYLEKREQECFSIQRQHSSYRVRSLV